MEGRIIPDDMLVAVALDDVFYLGVLSSAPQVTWALAAGSRLGVGNEPRCSKSKCVDAFPFPAAIPNQKCCISDLAEQLDAHHRRQQAQHPDLTLTGMYNVVEKLKVGAPLTAKEKEIHQQGLVSVLKTLHDEIDRTALEAYGWSDLVPLMEIVNGNAVRDRAEDGAPTGVVAPHGRSGLQAAICGTGAPAACDEAKRLLDEALLDRLVARNAERAAKERRDLIRWLRPEFQSPQGTVTAVQTELESTEGLGIAKVVTAGTAKRPWPKELTEQIKAVAAVLTDARGPQTENELAARFTGRGRRA